MHIYSYNNDERFICCYFVLTLPLIEPWRCKGLTYICKYKTNQDCFWSQLLWNNIDFKYKQYIFMIFFLCIHCSKSTSYLPTLYYVFITVAWYGHIQNIIDYNKLWSLLIHVCHKYEKQIDESIIPNKSCRMCPA